MVRDKYRIDAFIATGSMANVYAATHRNGNRVALKILHRDLADDPSMVERFRREGYFANAIGHPGVVRAIDDDVAEDGSVFIVMELLEGENLEERRKRLGGRIPLGEVLHIADAMLDVLAAAHDHQILHRDLKPENVFITRKNEVKLLDFGVARFNDGRSSSDMTGIGMVLGTPAFMPPEQALGRRADVDARSDIWSAGATLFTVLTGESVHAGGDAKSKLVATARKPARPLREVMPTIPHAIAAVIDRALAFDRAERWADAKAMREALRQARMSLNDETATLDRPTLDAMAPTRRYSEDAPTLARHGERPGLEDETTDRRGPARIDEHEPKPPERGSNAPPAFARRKPVSVDSVYTSAPPVTQRDPHRSMPPSEEDPTFSLRKVALKPRGGSIPPAASAREPDPLPVTERMPRHEDYETPRKTEVVTVERVILAPDVEPDPEKLFREALARAADGTDLATIPRRGIEKSTPPPPAPRPAAGAPPEEPPGRSPSLTTTPGIGGPPPITLSPLVEIGATTAPMPNLAVLPAPPPLHSPLPPPPGPGAGEPLPPALARSAPPPPTVSGSFPLPKAPSTSLPLTDAGASVPPPPAKARPSIAPETPGPLLSTIVPKRTSTAVRVLVTIFVGGLAGIATYVLVVRQPNASASHPAPAGRALSSDAEAPLASASSATASASVSPVGTLPAAPPTSSAALPSAPKPRPRPKPKKAAPPATATATTTAAEPPPKPAPTPVPTPVPVPTDTLPTKHE
jgi:serine/threonine-protein kinase